MSSERMKLHMLQHQSEMWTKAWLTERSGRLLKNVLMTWSKALRGRHTASTGASALQRHRYPWISIWTAHFPNTAFQTRLIPSDDVNSADMANEQATLKLLIRHNGVTIPQVRRLSYTWVNLGIPSTVKTMKGRLSRRKMGLGQAEREEY